MASKWRSLVNPGCDAHCGLPNSPAVYAVYTSTGPYRRLVLQYIGSTDSLASRVRHYFAGPRDGEAQHTAFLFSRWRDLWHKLVFKYRLVERQGEHLSAEYRLISRLDPPMNSRGSKRRPWEKYIEVTVAGYGHIPQECLSRLLTKPKIGPC